MTIHFKKILENLCIQYLGDNLLNSQITNTSAYNKLNNAIADRIHALQNADTITVLGSFKYKMYSIMQNQLLETFSYCSGALYYDIMKYCSPKISDSFIHASISILHVVLYSQVALCSIHVFDNNDNDIDVIALIGINSIITGITSYMGAKYGHGMFTNDTHHDNECDSNDLYIDNLYVQNIASIENI